MAASAGMDAVVKKSGTAIAGVRVSGVTRDATPIDITGRDASGLVTLLGGGKLSSSQLTFNVEGVEQDRVLEQIALDPSADLLLTDMTLELGSGYTIAGTFFMGNYQAGNDYKEASTFSAQFASSGAWTYTATV
jgi:predicted secreted protein